MEKYNQCRIFPLSYIILKTLIIFSVSMAQCLSKEELEKKLSDLYIDFDTSMQHPFSPTEYAKKLPYKKQRAEIPFLKELYEKNNFLKKLECLKNDKMDVSTKIPKIIHQIWLGSTFPECYKRNQESWKHLHPDWEYKLWTDSDIATFKLVNQDAFDKGRTWAEKANIFRYEIIERFGGVYIDTDFECIQPLDILHIVYEFYAGITTINRPSIINNAFIGARPNHPILQECIANIGKKNYGTKQTEKNGTFYFSNMLIELCKNNPCFDLNAIILLPPSYLYPLPEKKDPINAATYLILSSFAVHYWAAEWNKVSINGDKK